MISGLLNKLSKFASRDKQAGNIAPEPGNAPVIIPRKAHTISRRDISECALKVLYRLHKHGFKAYLVGGAVRDLLLGFHPKDFDIATDAKPEEVRALFRNCRLIGRRFRLAHVYFGEEIIEVATFRAKHTEDVATQSHSSEGMILRDNVYGTLEDDAWRRDFTINALYYNIADFSIVDYTGGLADLESRQLYLIGEPEKRFREDPVRILRVLRFASKLQLNIAPELIEPINQYKNLVVSVSPARLFEEVKKIFHSGEGVAAYELMQQFELFQDLFPFTTGCFAEKRPIDAFLKLVLTSTDQRIKADKPVTPAFLFAAIFWHPICQRAEALVQDGVPVRVAKEKVMESVFQSQLKTVSVPRRLLHAVREILMLQMRMEKWPSKKVERILYEPKFRAAFDFLELRAKAGEPMDEIVAWWKQFYESDTTSRKKTIKNTRHRKRRRGE